MVFNKFKCFCRAISRFILSRWREFQQEWKLQQFKKVFDNSVSKDILSDLVDVIGLGSIRSEENSSYQLNDDFFVEKVLYVQFRDKTICKIKIDMGMCGESYCPSIYGAFGYASCKLNGNTTPYHSKTIKMNTITPDRSRWTVDKH